MDEIELTNYKTLFPGEFSAFAAVNEAGELYAYFKCLACNEHATQEERTEPTPEIVLSCSCCSNYSLGVDTWDQIQADVAAVFATAVAQTEEEPSKSIWQRIVEYFTT